MRGILCYLCCYPSYNIYFLNGEANILWENFDADYGNDFEWSHLH
jgi:hypothetical protein